MGELHKLFRIFLRLKKTFKKTTVTFSSEGDGDCKVMLTVQTPGHGDQAPRRGGHHSGSHEESSGTQTSPAAPARVSGVKKPFHPPVPETRGRRQAPSALLCSEQRRLLRIDPAVLMEVEGGPALPPLAVKAPLALRAAHTAPLDATAPLALRVDETAPLALRERAGKVQVATPAPVRTCQKCQQPLRGHPGPTGLRRCTVSPAPPWSASEAPLETSPSPWTP